MDPVDEEPLNPDYAIVSARKHGYLTGDVVQFRDPDTPSLHNLDLTVYRLDIDRVHLRYRNGEYVTATQLAGAAFVLARRYRVDVPYVEAELREVRTVQDNDIMYLAHIEHPPMKLSRFGDTDWRLEVVDFTPNDNYPMQVTAVATLSSSYTRDDGNGGTEQVGLPTLYKYKVSTIDAETGEESLPSKSTGSAINDLALQGGKNRIAWTAVPGVERYVVYKNENGVYGYIGTTEDTFFNDANIVEDATDGPQQGVNPFDGPDNYPRTVALHEQRLVFASTKADPQAVFMSKSTLLENFDVASPAKPDDAITFRLKSKERQDILSMVSTSAGLALFTSTTEWMVAGGNDEGYLTPTNPRPLVQTRRGSYFLPPVFAGDTSLFAQARGGVVRDFTYSVADDAFNGPDRTIRARHLFRKTRQTSRRLVSWCYAQAPYSIIWAVRDDGVLLSLTYMREQDVWGWTRHETDGFVESVVSVPSPERDDVYITVRREVGGQQVRYHEKLATREIERVEDWFFVDSGLVYEGEPVEAVGGLQHLEGREVAILADGYVLPRATVENGRVELGNPYSVVTVGLPYQAEIETLDLDLGNLGELGTVQYREKSYPKMVVRAEYSRGLFVGQDRENLTEWRQRERENYGSPIDTYTGLFDIDFDTDYTATGNIVLRQDDPLPMTILSVAPDVTIGG